MRAARRASADPLPEGGASYGAAVCVDNFAEERRDRCYLSGSVPAIVRCKGMYQTEYIQRTNEALPGYRQRLIDAGRLAAKVPVPGQDHRNSRRPGYSTDYVQYARDGFVRRCAHCLSLLLVLGSNVKRSHVRKNGAVHCVISSRRRLEDAEGASRRNRGLTWRARAGTNADAGDATTEQKQGSAWVGTAPCHMMESVQRTTQAGRKPRVSEDPSERRRQDEVRDDVHERRAAECLGEPGHHHEGVCARRAQAREPLADDVPDSNLW